jgi:hypothetical protein
MDRLELVRGYLNNPEIDHEYTLFNRGVEVGKIFMSRQGNKMILKSGLPLNLTPYSMRNRYEEGKLEFSEEEGFERWVERRVIPENRDNIKEILEDIGIKYYDKFIMFLAMNGESNDHFSLLK